MINLAVYAEDVRRLILSMENSLSELGKLRSETKPEARLRRRVIDYLETASSSLIDAYELLNEAQACSDDGDLEQVLWEASFGEESEVEP